MKFDDPPVSEFGGSVSAEELGKFVDGGGNVLLAADSNLGEAIRDFATEVGFEFGNDGTAVIDHHNFDSRLDDGKHTTIVVPSSKLASAELIVGQKAKLGPVLFKGVALSYNDENRLRLSVLNAGTTAYAFNPDTPITEVGYFLNFCANLICLVPASNRQGHNLDWRSSGPQQRSCGFDRLFASFL